jgi:hypothetical protein
MLDEVTPGVVDAAYTLPKGLGPGLLESVYERGAGSPPEKADLSASFEASP